MTPIENDIYLMATLYGIISKKAIVSFLLRKGYSKEEIINTIDKMIKEREEK